jgi:hypothetical protein
VRVANSEELRAINAKAVRGFGNRTANAAVLAQLDPEGQHVCLRALPTGPEDQYIRTSWAVKVKGTDAPQGVEIDADWDDYLALPTTEEVLGGHHPQAE